MKSRTLGLDNGIGLRGELVELRTIAQSGFKSKFMEVNQKDPLNSLVNLGRGWIFYQHFMVS